MNVQKRRKMKNPFRTKRIIIAGIDNDTFIEVPFIGKIRMKQKKRVSRGRKLRKLIVYDEAQNIPEEVWEKLKK